MQLSKIYYFYDPMCGWCFGFANIMQRIMSEYPSVPIELVCGGMIKGAREGPVGEKGFYILQAIPRVENQTGARFGETYKTRISNGSMWNSSSIPSIAVNIVKALHPEILFDFCARLQELYFVDGKDLHEAELYRNLSREFDLDPEEFIYHMGDSHWQQRAQDDFDFTANTGITGFPTLVADVNGKLMLISYGYTRFDEIAESLRQLAHVSAV